jgi:hypothetical protein
MTDVKVSAQWLPIAETDWKALGESLIDLEYEDDVTREMVSASAVAAIIRENGGPGEILSYRPSVQLVPPDPTPGEPMEPKWVPMDEMPSMPRGWYWAGFPGGWEWYSPELNMTKGVDHGDARWHELMSLRYWGPFAGPPVGPVTAR